MFNSLLVVKSREVKRIMILNDQSTSHTLLKTHKETQPQNHLSSQASCPHVYDGDFDYENKEINSNYV
jgi:hypothetical protein